jgi:mutator protein MutT
VIVTGNLPAPRQLSMKGGIEVLTHAGGIVFRQREGKIFYLIVRAKPNPSHWVVPKGHIEAGESPEAAAVREIWEETGVQAKIVDSLGTLDFSYHDKHITTIIYLMEYTGESAPLEMRDINWGLYEETVNLLTFNDTREKLTLARKLLLQRSEAVGARNTGKK